MKPCTSLRLLLVDDERLARDRLRRLLQEVLGDSVFIYEAASALRAAEIVSQERLDLVFLDIQMPGENGFDFLASCRVGCPVVFVTAFDSYALRAFEVNALDYLLKPVAVDRLRASLVRLEDAGKFSHIPYQSNDKIFLKNDSWQRFIDPAQLWAIKAQGDYTELILSFGERPWIKRSLRSWLDALDKETYFRCHRSSLVRLDAVVALEKRRDGWMLSIGDGQWLPVSRRSLGSLKSLLAARAR